MKRTPRERQAAKASIARMDGQAESLGLLDPLDDEPAVAYDPEERER